MKLTNKQLRQLIKEELQNVLHEQNNFGNEGKLSVLQDVLNGIFDITTDQKASIKKQVKKYLDSKDHPQTFENALSMALNDTPSLDTKPEVKKTVKKDFKAAMRRKQ